ncbi:serine acetyltransferase [Clostridium septicum]|uniref:serine O-acetyltransferase n=1 Tax=Clostridium septicum TaxID=1504 RepID=UPI003217A056
MDIYKLYSISRKLYEKKIPIIPKLIKGLIRIVFSCVIPFTAKIGEGTKIGYQGLGVVIHANSIIGTNCAISQGVTIGGTSKKKGVPIIGNNVYIGAGAKIIGPITIGDNVVVGANAVVLKDVPSGCVVVGIPAKIIKTNILMSDYK